MQRSSVYTFGKLATRSVERRATGCLNEVHLPGGAVHDDGQAAARRHGRRVGRRSRLVLVLVGLAVVAGAEGAQVRVVRGRHERHRARATRVQVALAVGQILEQVGSEPVLVKDDVVVGRARRALDAGVRHEVEVELARVRDARVDDGAGGHVAGPVRLARRLRRKEETNMVAFLDNDERDLGRVPGLELVARLTKRIQLVLQDVVELALGHTIAVEQDAFRFLAARRLVEPLQQVHRHALQVLDDLLAVLLRARLTLVAERVRVHAGDDGGQRRQLRERGRMGDVGAEHDGRLAEQEVLRRVRLQDAVDTADTGVDLQQQVAGVHRVRLLQVPRLHALRRHVQDGVADALDLAVRGRVAERQDDQQQLALRLHLLLDVVDRLHQDVLVVGRAAPLLLVRDHDGALERHAVLLAGPVQHVQEPHDLVLTGALLQDQDAPGLHLGRREHAGVTRLPDTEVRADRLLARRLVIRHRRRLQDAAVQLDHLRITLDAKVGQGRVGPVAALSDRVHDVLDAHVRLGGRLLDHGGRLRRRQLLGDALAADHVADLHRQVRRLLFAADDQQWQVRVLQLALVPLLKVLGDVRATQLAVLLDVELHLEGALLGDVANAVLALRVAAMRHGNLHAGQLGANRRAVRVAHLVQRLPGHRLDQRGHRLGAMETGGGHVQVDEQAAVRGTKRLVVPEPDLGAGVQRRRVPAGEERRADGRARRNRRRAKDDVERLDAILWDVQVGALQELVQRRHVDDGDVLELNGELVAAVGNLDGLDARLPRHPLRVVQGGLAVVRGGQAPLEQVRDAVAQRRHDDAVDGLGHGRRDLHVVHVQVRRRHAGHVEEVGQQRDALAALAEARPLRHVRRVRRHHLHAGAGRGVTRAYGRERRSNTQ